MADNNNLVRIDLDAGDWAEIYPDLLHGVARRIELATRKYIKITDNASKLQQSLTGSAEPASKAEPQTMGKEMTAVQLEEKEGKVVPTLKAEVSVDLENIDFSEGNEIMVIGQTAKWSFGEVDKATLDRIPEKKYNKLQQEMDKRYGSNPLPVTLGNDSPKTSS